MIGIFAVERKGKPMEKSRAIELLEHLEWNKDIDRNPYGDALNMAIEALKEQLSKESTTSDLIDRQAALDIFDDYNVSVENGELEAYSRDRKRLCELSTIQPETPCYLGSPCEYQNPDVVIPQPSPPWIPVSERLPSKEERKEWIDNNLDGIGYLYPCLVTRYSSINPDRTKNNPYVAKHYFDGEDFLNAGEEVCSEYIIAWMPLPEAYKPNK